MAYGSSTLLGEDKKNQKNQKNQINQAINYDCCDILPPLKRVGFPAHVDKNTGYFE